MKNAEAWKPTKFVITKKGLRASRNPSDVAVSSRLMTDRVALQYDTVLRKHVSGKLIDLGCGKVPLYAAYRTFADTITCVDWSDHGGKNIHLDQVCDLNKPLPFPDDAFNTIILSDVLEHLSQPRQLWAEMARILSAKGKIILNVPFYYNIHEAPWDYYRYTEYALRDFAAQAGLEVVVLNSLGGAPEILADITAKVSQRIPVAGKTVATFIQWSCSLFLRTGFGRRLSLKTSSKFPIGYIMVAQKNG